MALNFEDKKNFKLLNFLDSILDNERIVQNEAVKSFSLIEDLMILVKFYKNNKIEQRFNKSKAINELLESSDKIFEKRTFESIKSRYRFFISKLDYNGLLNIIYFYNQLLKQNEEFSKKTKCYTSNFGLLYNSQAFLLIIKGSSQIEIVYKDINQSKKRYEFKNFSENERSTILQLLPELLQKISEAQEEEKKAQQNIQNDKERQEDNSQMEEIEEFETNSKIIESEQQAQQWKVITPSSSEESSVQIITASNINRQKIFQKQILSKLKNLDQNNNKNINEDQIKEVHKPKLEQKGQTKKNDLNIADYKQQKEYKHIPQFKSESNSTKMNEFIEEIEDNKRKKSNNCIILQSIEGDSGKNQSTSLKKQQFAEHNKYNIPNSNYFEINQNQSINNLKLANPEISQNYQQEMSNNIRNQQNKLIEDQKRDNKNNKKQMSENEEASSDDSSDLFQLILKKNTFYKMKELYQDTPFANSQQKQQTINFILANQQSSNVIFEEVSKEIAECENNSINDNKYRINNNEEILEKYMKLIRLMNQEYGFSKERVISLLEFCNWDIAFIKQFLTSPSIKPEQVVWDYQQDEYIFQDPEVQQTIHIQQIPNFKNNQQQEERYQFLQKLKEQELNSK